MADRIVLNTISYHGHGAIENIVPELTARGYKKAFVCSDPDLIKFGVTKKVTDLLDAANFAYAVYSEIKPNPTIANVQDGVAAFKAAEADCIVTIGGGSSMDTAKAIGIIINNPEFADVRSLEGALSPVRFPNISLCHIQLQASLLPTSRIRIDDRIAYRLSSYHYTIVQHPLVHPAGCPPR